MESQLGRLVTFRTKNNYEIIGMLFCDQEKPSETIIIHIHGNFGNFYQNKFIWYMSDIYPKNGIDFLSINLLTHDGLAEGYCGRDLKYVGGGISNYNSSQDDIEAAISFVTQKGYKRIILQGHSLGCDKIIQYTIEKECNLPIVLLSPVDSYKVQSEWIKPESIESQIARLSKGKKALDDGWGKADFDWVESTEYGAKGDSAEWTYQIPITREALISILSGAAFKYLNLDYGKQFSIQNTTFAFVGLNDGLQMHEHYEWISFLHKSFRNLKIVSDLYADHDVAGVEIELCEKIVQWVVSLIP